MGGLSSANVTMPHAKGKHYRVAVSHVARKLVHILYAVLAHERPYALPPA